MLTTRPPPGLMKMNEIQEGSKIYKTIIFIDTTIFQKMLSEKSQSGEKLQQIFFQRGIFCKLSKTAHGQTLEHQHKLLNFTDQTFEHKILENLQPVLVRQSS